MLKTGSIKKSYVFVFLAASALYVITCAPGVLWQDSGMTQYRVWQNDIAGGLGLALSHPLFYIIAIMAKFIPAGEFAYRINLVSALAGAAAVANLFLLLRLWLGRGFPAVIAAAVFAVSWTHWQFSTIAEVYTLYSAVLFAELIMLLQYVKTKRIGFLYLLAFFNGLAAANHMWAVIALVCYAVFLAVLIVQKRIGPKHIGIFIILWLLGAAPYVYLIVKTVISTGDFAAVASSVFFGSRWQGQVLNVSVSGKIVVENLIFMAYNFPAPNIIFFFVGLYGLKKTSPTRSFTYILIVLVVLFFVFAFRYAVPDRYAFFTPFYCLVSVLIGVGVDFQLKRAGRTKIFKWALIIFALMPIPVYIIAPVMAERVQFGLSTKRQLPYRNDYRWFLQPWHNNCDGPERFAEEALLSVEDNAVIIADGTTVYALWHAQAVKGINTGVKVVSEHGDYKSPMVFPDENNIGRLMDENEIYVVSPVTGYCPDFVLEKYDFIRTGVLWKVVERK